MTDIFREIEEEVRREQYEKLWKKYRDHVIAAAALVIIGVAGYQLYRVYEQREANTASVAFEAATQMLDAGQPRAAEPEIAALARNAPGGYAKVASLAQADALFAAGDHVAAIKLYEKIANGGDPYLGPLARLHAAWATVDGATRQEMESLLAPLTDPTSPWHSMAQEILAYEDLRTGDAAQALRSYRKLASEPGAPSSLHTRAVAMVRFLEGGGDIDYGHVPQAKPAPASIIPSSITKGPAVR